MDQTSAEGGGPATEKISGEVLRVLFANADNGYQVVRILTPERREETLCGTLFNVDAGQYVEAFGSWIEHPEYGRQFRAESAHPVLPESALGLKRFLASGIIPGIGRKTAEAIVDYFGESTADVLSNHSNRLREIPKLGMKKIAVIREAWKQYAERRNSAVFLQGLGVSPAYCARLFKRYGDNAAQLVKQNPYRLAQEVEGIGFLKADQIAASLGIGAESPERLGAGAVYALDQQIQRGHCCYPDAELRRELAELLKLSPDLAQRGLETAVEQKKIILDGEFAYLPYLLRAECELPRQIARLARIGKFAGRVLARVPPKAGLNLSDEQLAAVTAVSATPLSIITGGPGVGKTTVLGEIVRRAGRAGLRLALAAPTGRAAKRLAEATGEKAKTLHRLLGFDAATNTFQFNQEKPLEIDLILVDEVSMLDLPLALALFRAVRTGASLVLIGDADQLPSVGPGAVLADLLASENYFTVTRLTKIFRQGAESAIIINAHRVNAGLPPLSEKTGAGAPEQLRDFYWIEQDEPAAVLGMIEKLLKRIPERFGFDPVEDVQILTPMNRGICGTLNFNTELQKLLNPGDKESVTVGERIFKLDDKVMQTANNYDKNVFNGDMGRVRYVNAKERVVAVRFDSERLVKYTGEELAELVHAYAVTVHKSQGCEFQAVIVTMLSQHYMMLERNLLYTAMTRAKKLLILIGGRKPVEMAVANFRRETRYTRLRERLAELTAVLNCGEKKR